MDEEVLKWSRKDPAAIKRAMAYPGINYKFRLREFVVQCIFQTYQQMPLNYWNVAK